MPQKFLTPKQEIELISKGYDLIVGVDEAGRGPWAGPVAVGFCVFQKTSTKASGIKDSKRLSPKARDVVFSKLTQDENNFCLLANSEEIDEVGIGKAIAHLITKGIEKIQKPNKSKRILFLIDGYFKEKFEADYELVKKGDSKYYSIAAASIMAKETRDKLMLKYAEKFPEYGFDRHVGYGTKLHKQMLTKYGSCEIHRRSFKPVRDLQKPI